VAYGGKRINICHKREKLACSRKTMNLSDSRERRPLAFAATLQLSLGLLDLVGIATIGLVAAAALLGVGIPENILDAPWTEPVDRISDFCHSNFLCSNHSCYRDRVRGFNIATYYCVLGQATG
jgi:hypothetical protein